MEDDYLSEEWDGRLLESRRHVADFMRQAAEVLEDTRMMLSVLPTAETVQTADLFADITPYRTFLAESYDLCRLITEFQRHAEVQSFDIGWSNSKREEIAKMYRGLNHEIAAKADGLLLNFDLAARANKPNCDAVMARIMGQSPSPGLGSNQS